MKTKRKVWVSAVAAAALAVTAVASTSVPVSARTSEIRYLPRASAHAHHAPQPRVSGDIYESLSQGHQSYSNPDRDYFSGVNEGTDY
jgi:hypothetical protein